MARLARVVAPDMPHYLTERGNRGLPTFFRKDDYGFYLDLMREWCTRHEVDIWAYCLMPNHVNLVAVPQTEEGLCFATKWRAIGETHRRYTLHVNARKKWRGHLWQGRFASFAMDEDHLLSALRYIELNPVRAGVVEKPDDYAWSSARAHLSGEDDRLVSIQPMLSMIGDWQAYLAMDLADEEAARIRLHERTGRPLGSPGWLARLEQVLDRSITPKKRGPNGPRKND